MLKFIKRLFHRHRFEVVDRSPLITTTITHERCACGKERCMANTIDEKFEVGLEWGKRAIEIGKT